ncbi:MAG TPA: RidA family protein [Galbitalea sp.]|jgi:enamine deaminase RidA (YjgF/YER057c/UK114 family)
MSDGIQIIETGISAQIGQYADAVRIPAGYDQIVLSGTPGLSLDGTLANGIEAQAEQAWHNIEAILAASGAELSDIVSVRQWLRDESDIAGYVSIRKRYVKHSPTFMLGVGVGLVRPEFLVEVEVVAAVPPTT